MKAEQHQRQLHKEAVPAKDFQDYEGSTLANLIEEIQGNSRHISIVPGSQYGHQHISRVSGNPDT